MNETLLVEALDRIAELQPQMVEKLRRHGIVFDAIGADPQNWQHVAFTIYCALCEADSIARSALDEQLGRTLAEAGLSRSSSPGSDAAPGSSEGTR